MRITGTVKVIEYPEKIMIYKQHRLCAEYAKAGEDVKNKKFPEERNGRVYGPKNMKKGCEAETTKLKAIAPCVNAYLNFIQTPACQIVQKHKFIRDLYQFSKRMSEDMFIKCVHRALQYQIDTIEALERVYIHILGLNQHQPELDRKGPRERPDVKTRTRKAIISIEEDLSRLLKSLEKKGPPQE